ncbi:hypothetical protein SEEH1025_04220 [Salmonella enterica subsp. enterica serovar Heidelberg str. 670102-5]|nr:hypothetical protein SEEH4496_17359 [Salmonella enterica subsp. enterica serovar Heidelberg str. N4496]KDU69715.1 hypothetical protein SEEH5111_15084 [Salmonella enterica subsp. enterica serovar Heidelberg str. 640151-11]KJT26391.1 hypothetical protein SEEH1025_04220 [Salmonella enterica subsp. enterica serovar Heidelberg str. 670102-5]KJT63056.1 hypothetical protein SEEH3712_13192 [Salmonella enterica subsp. enterica serovar Heidelberg str. 622737-12]
MRLLTITSKEFAITYQFTRVTVLYSGADTFCQTKWLMLERHQDIISGRGCLRINIPTAIPLLRLLHRKFERVSMSRAGKGYRRLMLPAIAFIMTFGQLNAEPGKTDFSDQ